MEQEDRNHNQRANAPDHGAMMAVVSGDSEGPSDDEDEDIFETTTRPRVEDNVDSTLQGDGFLYDENLDDEDERYVYHNLRGGKHEAKRAGDDSKNGIPAVQKPRNSDAVLACPCCFNILSLDTQRHYKYQNQYRAMFVMGIGVDWQHLLKYDKEAKGLVRWTPPRSSNPPAAAQGTQIVAPDHQPASETEDPIYYSVHCAGCRTQVGALDMADEVYHFYDCLASA